MRTSYQGANRDPTASFDQSLESGPLVRRQQAPEPVDPIIAPSTTSRFVLRDALGRGGMGVVYRAYDAELGLDVALKALNDLGSEGRSWLKAEFRSLAGIVHPNLVQLHELVVDDQRCFFTMELVRGLDLVEFFLTHSEHGGSRTPLAEWLQLARESARQLAHALASLHRAGKLHRDVKPSNVLVTDAGRVVLLDFGWSSRFQPPSIRRKGDRCSPERSLTCHPSKRSADASRPLRIGTASELRCSKP